MKNTTMEMTGRMQGKLTRLTWYGGRQGDLDGGTWHGGRQGDLDGGTWHVYISSDSSAKSRDSPLVEGGVSQFTY